MNKNYAIMRHAVMDDDGLAPDSFQVLCEVGKKFATIVGSARVRIYHSPKKRAEATAHSLAELLNGFSSAMPSVSGELAWLDCESFAITDRNIESMLEQGAFTVLVTHQPDMERYIRSRGSDIRVGNCAIWSPRFTIEGH